MGTIMIDDTGRNPGSRTNDRLRRPHWAATLAKNSVALNPAASDLLSSHQQQAKLQQQEVEQGEETNKETAKDRTESASLSRKYRVVLGLGPGRSGTKSVAELLNAQANCRCEHEMIVPRGYRRDNQEVVLQQNKDGQKYASRETKSKGSWGTDKRLEWDPPRLSRGAKERTEEEAAAWRVTRILDQRQEWTSWIESDGWKYNLGHRLEKGKPRKLGAKGWREHNAKLCNGKKRAVSSSNVCSDSIPVVAAVSSVGMAFVHEYVAMDPTVRIIVVMRPMEEVVLSFVEKSIGRNHWQKHESKHEIQFAPDKTWDSAFPNMNDEECEPFWSEVVDAKSRPDKVAALRAYWELYKNTANELEQQYPENVRVFNMDTVLNCSSNQEAMLLWCGFQHPELDIDVRLNRSPKIQLGSIPGFPNKS